MAPTLAWRLAEATRLLEPHSDSPRLDAELLLAHALGLSRSRMLAHLTERRDACGFDELVARRAAHEPVAYILGEWEFFSLPLYVEAPMLVPRPETEHLVEVVLEWIGDKPARVLDLCTGTGCVAVAIVHSAPQARVVATDINPAALALARRNAERLGVQDRVEFRLGDFLGALPEGTSPFDVVCSNPPYVEEAAWADLAPDIRQYEDPRALLAGADGLDAIRRIAGEACGFLAPHGRLAFEVGMGQYEDVAGILGRCGFQDIGFRLDLAGVRRIVTAAAADRVRQQESASGIDAGGVAKGVGYPKGK